MVKPLLFPFRKKIKKTINGQNRANMGQCMGQTIRLWAKPKKAMTDITLTPWHLTSTFNFIHSVKFCCCLFCGIVLFLLKCVNCNKLEIVVEQHSAKNTLTTFHVKQKCDFLRLAFYVTNHLFPVKMEPDSTTVDNSSKSETDKVSFPFPVCQG